tara:strand:- start:32 stop:265 length:234 start_codon:yes stop_codon:yes gene_type:complete
VEVETEVLIVKKSVHQDNQEQEVEVEVVIRLVATTPVVMAVAVSLLSGIKYKVIPVLVLTYMNDYLTLMETLVLILT